MLLQAGHQITVVDNFLYNQYALADCCADPKFTLVRGDCRDDDLLTRLVPEVDFIIPLAAIVGAPACEADKIAARTTNLDAIKMLMQYRSKSQAILFPTSNSGYGIGGPKECDEDSPMNPVSLYGTLKVEAEKVVLDGGNSISFRFATLMGISERMRFNLLVNDFVRRALIDRFVVVFEGYFRRNYLHVRDAASVFLWAIEHYDDMKEKSYNVGLPDANLTKIQLCETIKKYVLDFYYCEAPIGKDPDRRNYIVNNQRILNTGWRPQLSLDDTIQELIRAMPIYGDFR
mgnify:FL=1